MILTMQTNEITGVNKISSNNKYEVWEYRDMYNDIKTVEFPTSWEMTDDQVEKYLIEK